MADETGAGARNFSSADQTRSRVLRGLSWKLASQVTYQVSRVVVAVILARLLAPHDYGIAGMVLVASSLVFIFSDLALGAALVQRDRLTEEDRSTVLDQRCRRGPLHTRWNRACRSDCIVLRRAARADLFMVLSITFAIAAVGSTSTALLTREMDFRSLELRNIAGTVAGAIVGVTSAALGAGALAIILQQLTVSTVSTALVLIYTPWRPRLTYSTQSLRRLGSFSGNIFGTRLLFYTNRNADNLLIGRFLGAAALGSYAVAYNVMLVPMNQIAEPIQEVLLPALARMQHDVDRMGRAWLRVIRLVGAVSIPALIGMVVVAPDFVEVVLGPKWSAATPVIQTAWVGLLQSLQRLNSSVLQARNRTATLLRYAVIVCVASLIAFVGGLHWGIVGVAVGYAISSTIVEPYYMWLTARALGLGVMDVLRELTGIVEAAAVMTVVVLATRMLLMRSDLGPGARLPILIVVGAAAYVPMLLWRGSDVVREVRSLRRRPGVTPAADVP